LLDQIPAAAAQGAGSRPPSVPTRVKPESLPRSRLAFDSSRGVHAPHRLSNHNQSWAAQYQSDHFV